VFLSKTAEYAIRLVFFLLKNDSDRKYIQIKHIAPELGVSFYQLTKVAHRLTQAGILTSYTGPNGGVTLKLDPKSIRLIDIVAPIDGDDLFERCMLGLDECGDDDPCPVHAYWKETKRELKRVFHETTMDDMREHALDGRLSQTKIRRISE